LPLPPDKPAGRDPTEVGARPQPIAAVAAPGALARFATILLLPPALPARL